MGMFGDGGSYAKWPKVGEPPIEITIMEINKIDRPGYEYNFKKKGGINAGYHYELILDDGKKLSLSTWKLYFEIQNSKAELGEKIRVSHPKEKDWKVEKI